MNNIDTRKNMKNSGKYYEKKTAKMLQKFNPQLQVQDDVKILGKLSNTLRQIDVLIEPSKFENLIFECKDRTRPVDLDTFGVFVSILDDIGVNGKAAVVSNSPYSEGVRNMATSKGIDLLHIIDTNDSRIRTQLRAPALLNDVKLKYIQFSFQTTANFSGITANPVIVGPHCEGSPKDYLTYLWNETSLLKESTGDHQFELENSFLVDTSGSKVPFKITFNYGVEEEHYLGDLAIQNTQGIYNVQKKTYQTNSLETEPLVAYEVEKVWKKITDQEAKNTSVSMGFGCKSVYPL